MCKARVNYVMEHITIETIEITILKHKSNIWLDLAFYDPINNIHDQIPMTKYHYSYMKILWK